MDIGDIVRHKLTKEKVLIVDDYLNGWSCRTEDYSIVNFSDDELEEIKEG